MTTHGAVHEIKACRFYDAAGDRLWSGYTDGSRWNGFLNVLVDEAVFKRLWMSWYGYFIMHTNYDEDEVDPGQVPVIHTKYGRLHDLGNCYATIGEHDACPDCDDPTTADEDGTFCERCQPCPDCPDCVKSREEMA